MLGVKSFLEEYEDFYCTITKVIESWMYSWMKMDCETKDEYLYSKKIFKKFVQCYEIEAKLSPLFAKSVLTFIVKKLKLLRLILCFI